MFESKKAILASSVGDAANHDIGTWGRPESGEWRVESWPLPRVLSHQSSATVPGIKARIAKRGKDHRDAIDDSESVNVGKTSLVKLVFSLVFLICAPPPDSEHETPGHEEQGLCEDLRTWSFVATSVQYYGNHLDFELNPLYSSYPPNPQ